MPRRLDSQSGGHVGLLQVALAGVLWGTGGLAVQLIRRHAALSVVTISAWRSLVGAVVLLAAVLAQRQGPGLAATVRRHPAAVTAAGVGTAAYQVLYFVSVVNVGVSVATVVSLGLAPVVLTAGSSLRARRRPQTEQVQVIALAVVGLALVSLLGAGHTAGPHPVLGLVAALGSGSVYAATVAVASPLAGQGSPVLVTTAASVIGAAALVPVAALSSAGIETGHRPSTLVGLAYLGALTMALAYGLFYAGLRTTPQSSAVIATLLEPVTAAIAAAAVLGERLGPGAVAGAVMILGSVVLLWLRDRAPEPMDV